MFLGVQIHPCGSFHGCFPGRGNQRLNTELTSNQVLRSLDPLKPLRVPFTQHFPNLRCHPKRISLKKKNMKATSSCKQFCAPPRIHKSHPNSQRTLNDPYEWRSYRFEASLMNPLQKVYVDPSIETKSHSDFLNEPPLVRLKFGSLIISQTSLT